MAEEWFELSVRLRLRAADEEDAIDRAAAIVRAGYVEAREHVYPVADFSDPEPIPSPIGRVS